MLVGVICTKTHPRLPSGFVVKVHAVFSNIGGGGVTWEVPGG
jgi:hypothetical protein